MEGPYGRVGLGRPVYAYTAEDCAIEFARRAERLHAPESGAAG